jgi:UTP--glucose-1-phosphate uridylyltransferase
MKATRAVVTAASPDHRSLPLQTLVDRDGRVRSVLEILLREIHSCGIEDVCVVIHPGDGEAYRQALTDLPVRLTFVEQRERLGYGHALSLAREFTAGEPFFHTVCDHLFISRDPDRSCARQLVECAAREGCSVSAVQSTRETEIHLYGAVSGTLQRGADREPLYLIRNVIEKPTPTEAEQKLIVPGLRAGQYLTFFGMHVLTPAAMDLLASSVARARHDGGRNVQLSPVLAELAARERYGAVLVHGSRHHISLRYGLFYAQLALALHGSDQAEVLRELVDLLARSHRDA